MSPRERSYEHVEVGQQLYAVIEFCRRPTVLWRKLSTGNYDWLGVRGDGRFVLGRPRLASVVEHGSGPADPETLAPHRVEHRAPLDRCAGRESFASPAVAREAYARAVDTDPVTPLHTSGIWKVQLYVDGELAEERLVFRTLPRMI